MNSIQRMLAFFSTMAFTFGITGLNFEHPEYVNNEIAYFFIGVGAILLLLFVVFKIRGHQ